MLIICFSEWNIGENTKLLNHTDFQFSNLKSLKVDKSILKLLKVHSLSVLFCNRRYLVNHILQHKLTLKNKLLP